MKTIKNFGKNVSFNPKHYYEPYSEQEVLDILNKHNSGTIRVLASGHAWSEAIATNDVCINIHHLNSIAIVAQNNGRYEAHLGGGVTLQALLNEAQKYNLTLPTMGGIRKQTIAGATSTGTHGSGRPSVSHYLSEVRIAAFDQFTGKATIRTYTEGDGLRAARAALGCLGIVVSVKLPLVPDYWVTTTIYAPDSLNDILKRDKEEFIEQFLYTPFSWRLFLYERRIELQKPKRFSRFGAYLHRLYDFISVDVVLHVLVACTAYMLRQRIVGVRWVRWLYGPFLAKTIGIGSSVVDVSEPAITLAHDLFTHLEMELFVPTSKLAEVLRTVRYVTDVCAGVSSDQDLVREQNEILKNNTMYDELLQLKGTYIQHYPLYFRRVLRDDTLISMQSDIPETYYSISFFTYHPAGKRSNFYAYTTFIARLLTKHYSVRTHWGKYNPLSHNNIAHLFPHLETFRTFAQKVDPRGVFQNNFTREKLGF